MSIDRQRDVNAMTERVMADAWENGIPGNSTRENAEEAASAIVDPEETRKAADEKLDRVLEADDYADTTKIYANPVTRNAYYEKNPGLKEKLNAQKGFPTTGAFLLTTVQQKRLL